MNRNSILAGAILFILALTNITFAGPQALNKDEVEKLIKGNTVEGVDTKWNKKMIWFFNESGKLKKLDDRGQKAKADWNIDSRGYLCITEKGKKLEKCEQVFPHEGGGYAVPGRNWQWDKITAGNPNKL